VTSPRKRPDEAAAGEAAAESRPEVESPNGAPPPEADAEAPEPAGDVDPDAADEPAPAGDADPDAGRQLEQDIDQLVAKAAERDEYLALAQRTQADFENYRKRMAREAGAAEARGLAKLARELLPAIDNLALALTAADDGAGEHLRDGIRLVQSELVAALARVGIEPYFPEGEPFDPELHEAMAQQPVEGVEPGTIVEVYQQGYRHNGTVLRPARVVVAA
jgi:molecular chaperone GrpE